MMQLDRPYLGKRSSGRPQMRQADDLKNVTGFGWIKTTPKSKTLGKTCVEYWTMEGKTRRKNINACVKLLQFQV